MNALDGDRELTRVGKVVWRKVVDLGFSPEQKNQWIRHGLDLTPLVQKQSGRHVSTDPVIQTPAYCLCLPRKRGNLGNTMYELAQETGDWSLENGYWDSYQNYMEFDWDEWYDNRENPCHPFILPGTILF